MVTRCSLTAGGPSEAANATRRAPLGALKGAVVTRPMPSTEMVESTVGAPAPSESTIPTGEPETMLLPAEGDWLITRPASTDELYSLATVPLTRPAPPSAASAPLSVRPATDGTVT